MRPLAFALLLLALLVTQTLIGGTRPVFSLPGYFLLGLSGVALVFVRQQAEPLRRSCWLAAFALFGWVAGRALFSPVEYLARTDLFMVVGALFVYLATACYFTTVRLRLIALVVFLAGALIHVGVGAIQFKQGDGFMLLPGFFRPAIYEWRASGFYICPNHLAGLLEMVALLAISYVCWGQGKAGWRILAAYTALMCLAGLAITGSRGGYLSVVFGFGVFLILSLATIFRVRRRLFWPMFGVVAVGFLAVLGSAVFFMLKNDLISQRVNTVYDPQNMRLFMWEAALKQHELQPVIGTGSGTYLYYGRQFRLPQVQNDPMHVHNDYLELLAEYGWIGVALCAAFVLAHLVSGFVGWRALVRDRWRFELSATDNSLALTIGALSAIAALLLHSIVDFNLHIPANTLFTAFIFGILATPLGAGMARPVAAPATGSQPWWRWVSFALAVLLLVIAGRYLPGEYYAERSRVALRDDHFEEAVDFAAKGLEWEQKNPYLFGHFAEAKHFLTLHSPDEASGRVLHEEAVTAYRKAVQIYPRDTGLLLKFGQTLDLLGQFPEAREVYRSAIAGDPNFGNVYAYYGRHWLLQRHFRTAERYYQHAASLGEKELSPRGLDRIAKLRQNPLGETLISGTPEPESDLAELPSSARP